MPTTRVRCPPTASSESVLTTNTANSSVHARSPSDRRGQQKCAAEERCRKTQQENQQIVDCGLSCDGRSNQFENTGSKRTPTKSSGRSSVEAESEAATGKADVVADRLLSYGFDAADWLDDSFTDENAGSDTAKPSPCSRAKRGKDRSTKPCFKIYEDHDVSAPHNAATGYSLKNSSTQVLSDRTNVAHHSSQIWTKNSSLGIRRTRGTVRNLCEENEKPRACGLSRTRGVHLIPTAGVVDSAKNSLNFLRESANGNIDIRVSETCSEVNNSISRADVIAPSSATVSGIRTESLSTVTQVTASCQTSLSLSSVPGLKSSPVSSCSSATSTVDSRISLPNAVSCVSCVTVSSSTVVLSESVKHQLVGNGRSSFGSSSAAPRLHPATVRTPQNQSSARATCSTEFATPVQLVTPYNRSIQTSIMKPTPPMCGCGCRAKRKFVQSPGQNIGRPFYCCGAGARTSRKGCNFFKWENSCSAASVVRPSEVTPLSTNQFSSVHTTGRNTNFTPRQATSFRVLVPPSLK